jgi:hypothetical protein
VSDSTERLTAAQDTIYKMLANRRRRYVVHYLKYRGDGVDLGTLAEQVAAWEYGVDRDRLAADQRKNVYTALQQRHLPKLDDAGLVAFDSREGTVTPTDALAEVDIYTEVVQDGEFAWSQYYLGLAGVTTALMLAVWADVEPLVGLPDVAWGIFCTTAFVVSAAFHVVAAREMKLGAGLNPPDSQG